MRLQLRDIMVPKVVTIAAAQTAERAWHLMRQRGLHHLVVTRNGAVAGVLSARDMGGARGASSRKGCKVSDLMSPDVITAKATSTVRQGAGLMRGRSIGCLPVLDGKRLVGIITVSDLLELIGTGVERPLRRIQRYSKKGPGRR